MLTLNSVICTRSVDVYICFAASNVNVWYDSNLNPFVCSQNAAADSEAKNAELNRAVEELNKLLKETMEGLNYSL